MQTVKQPYEFLARWDGAGVLAGAQIQYRYIIRDGEQVVTESVGPAEPIPATIDGTFPLSSVIGDEQHQFLAAIASRDAEIAARTAVISERDTEIAAREADIAERDAVILARDAEIAALRAEIARLTAEVA